MALDGLYRACHNVFVNQPLLIIDAREAMLAKRTGKGQWTRGLISALLQRGANYRICLLAYADDASVPPEWQKLGVLVQGISARGIRWQLRAAWYVWQQRPRIYLSPISYIIPACLGWLIPCVTVVHDLIAFRGEPHDVRATRIERWTLPAAVRFSRSLLAISAQTKQDLLAKFTHLSPDRVTTVYAGPMRQFTVGDADNLYILSVGTLCPRKNQKRLVQAYAKLPAELRAKHALILAGAPGWEYQDTVELVKKTPGAEWRGYIQDSEYFELLRHAYVFALPSLYEGFGLQVLDSLQVGIPTLTSRAGSLAEVAGPAAFFVDPLSVEAIASALLRLLTDAELRQQLRAQGPIQAAKFSWDRTAGLVQEVFDRVA